MTEHSSTGTAALLPCPLCQSSNTAEGVCYVEDNAKEPAVRCWDCGCRATLKAWQSRRPAQGTRVPKVRTSHHRNKEEAARLQELVAKRYAAQQPNIPAQGSLDCAHLTDDVRFGPRVPVRWGTALTQVCKCGAWRTMHHMPGQWQTSAFPSTDSTTHDK